MTRLVSIFEIALMVYAITFLIATSRAAQLFRNLFRRAAFAIFRGTDYHNSFVHVVHGNVVLENDVRDEDDVKKIGVGYDFISCRMCVGVWVTIPFAILYTDPATALQGYALAYFLATQERK